jgi:hypothetical protein
MQDHRDVEYNRPTSLAPRADRIVERVRLNVEVSQDRRAIAQSTALVAYTPPVQPVAATATAAAAPTTPTRRPAPSSPQTTERASAKRCRVRLGLDVRKICGHELAASADADDAASSRRDAYSRWLGGSGDDDRAVVTLALAGGGTVDVPARAAARASPVLGRLVDRGGGAQFRESRTGVFSLAAHPPAAVRGVAAWVAAADGPPKRAAAAALLTDGALVVAAARLAHFLQIAPLCDAALDAIGSALDRSNAPSILLLARELGSRPLEERAVAYAAAQFGAIRRNSAQFGATRRNSAQFGANSGAISHRKFTDRPTTHTHFAGTLWPSSTRCPLRASTGPSCRARRASSSGSCATPPRATRSARTTAARRRRWPTRANCSA